MFSINIKRSVVTVGVVAGLLAAAGPARAEGGGADFTRFVESPHGVPIIIAGTADDQMILRGGSSEVLMETTTTLKGDSNEVAVEGLKEGVLDRNDGSRHVRGIGGDDTFLVQSPTQPALTINSTGFDPGTQAREPAHTITMMDYELNPVVTY